MTDRSEVSKFRFREFYVINVSEVLCKVVWNPLFETGKAENFSSFLTEKSFWILCNG